MDTLVNLNWCEILLFTSSFNNYCVVVSADDSPLLSPSSSRRAMFMSGLSESKQTHVHLRNVDPATLQIIITYAYTGNLAISDSTVEPLYETACFLQVNNTSRQCIAH